MNCLMSVKSNAFKMSKKKLKLEKSVYAKQMFSFCLQLRFLRDKTLN